MYVHACIWQEAAWGELRGKDELLSEMKAHKALYGFHEPTLGFPPSFRRIPGSDCEGYKDADHRARAPSPPA